MFNKTCILTEHIFYNTKMDDKFMLFFPSTNNINNPLLFKDTNLKIRIKASKGLIR